MPLEKQKAGSAGVSTSTDRERFRPANSPWVTAYVTRATGLS